jgi:hypothetical protein
MACIFADRAGRLPPFSAGPAGANHTHALRRAVHRQRRVCRYPAAPDACPSGILEKNRHQVRAAGPLLDRQGHGAGGLWVVDADGPDSVMALVQADPFWPTGLRKDVRVLEWKQVFEARSNA